MKTRHIALCAAAAWLSVGLAAADAQQNGPAAAAQKPAARPRSSMTSNLPPQDEAQLRARHPELYVLPAVSHSYQPKRTSWGDPDLRGMWPIDSLGGLPALTPEARRLDAIGRSSWVKNQSFDWVTDFDSWDRCISRGFPASMLPFRYNNGIQILQAPGYVVVNLEMIHDARIIPLDGRPAPPSGVVNWMGESRGHWEGATLVVETDHIKTGAAPLNMATIGAPANNTIPMSAHARVTERFTLTGANTLTYEMTYSDPVYWTQPFTVRADWTRNQKYKFYEYACHEGDEQVRNYIVTSRIQRAKDNGKPVQAVAQTAAATQAR